MKGLFCRFLLLMIFWVAASAVAQNKLFPIALYQSDQGYVYDFIDRYFGELQKIKNHSELLQKLNDDKVFFAQGSVSDISLVNDKVPFVLNRIEDRYFEATWRNENSQPLTILFPVSFELLLGQPKAEIEKTIEKEIKNAKASGLSMAIPEAGALIFIGNGLYQTNPKQHYELESLNNCCYYILDSNGVPQLVKDERWLEKSVINLMHDALSDDYIIEVEQGVYGFKQLHFTMQLSQWHSYCRSKNMNLYVAVEEELSDAYKMLVVAECRELAFNHLLSIYVPKDCLRNPGKAWRAQMNAYIPTHNVKDLYQQYKQRAKREIAL